MTTKARDRFRLALLGAIIVIAVALRVSLGPQVLDDAYITFRYARNLASGLGFVYNTGERVLGTTTPLFTLMLALGFKLGADPHILALALNTVADVVSIVIIYFVCRRLGVPVVGLLAALMVAISGQFITYTASGMETSLYIATLLAAWGLYAVGLLMPAFAMAGVACLVRPDAILMVAVLYVALLLRTHRFDLRPILVTLLVAAPWLIFATFYFGSPLPMSVQAKATDAMDPGFTGMSLRTLSIQFLSLKGSIAGADKNLLFTLLFAVGCVAITLTTWRRSCLGASPHPRAEMALLPTEKLDRVFPLLLWSIAYVVIFTLAGAFTYFPWYVVPLYPAYFVVLLVGLGWLADRLVPNILARVQLPAWGDLVLLPLLVVTVLRLPSRAQGQQLHAEAWIERREGAYQRASEFVLGNAGPDDQIAAGEVGVIGYYSQRYIVDVNGLVTPRLPGEGPVDIFIRHQTEWIIDTEGGWSSALDEVSWFQALYEQAWQVPGTEVLVFRKLKEITP